MKNEEFRIKNKEMSQESTYPNIQQSKYPNIQQSNNMKLNANSVSEYYDLIPEDRQAGMREMREIIIETAPDVNEVFKYNLPYYPIGDQPFISLASQKHHISFYLNDPVLIKEFLPKLGKVSSGKNCIRFKKFENINKEAFRELIRLAYIKRI